MGALHPLLKPKAAWRLAYFRDVRELPPFLRGKDVWIRNEYTLEQSGHDPMTGEPVVLDDTYQTYLVNYDATLVRVKHDAIRLTDTYALQVKLVPFMAWYPQAKDSQRREFVMFSMVRN